MENVKKKSSLERYYELLENKQYDLIYQYYGKIVYLFSTPSSYKKSDFEKLLNEQQYGGIYNKYGLIKQIKVNRLRNVDIKNLIEEGRFEDIYRKYGEVVYNNNIRKMMVKDVFNETDSNFKAKLYKCKHKLMTDVKEFSQMLATLAMASTILLVDVNLSMSNLVKENEVKYAIELQAYNENLQQYVDEVNDLNLNDLQLIMKIMDDTWSSIQGYGNPKYDVFGLGRLDMMPENGVGVCRHLADDFTAKMNAINPKYNARNLVVYFDSNQYDNSSMAKISRNLVNNQNETYVQEENNNDEIKVDLTNVIGNHMVSLIDIPEQNVTLVVDITNPSIGVLKNGEIFMFSTKNNKGLEYKIFGELLHDDLPTNISIRKDFLQSNFVDVDINKLNNLYGLEAQNEALDYVRSLNSEMKHFE